MGAREIVGELEGDADNVFEGLCEIVENAEGESVPEVTGLSLLQYILHKHNLTNHLLA